MVSVICALSEWFIGKVLLSTCGAVAFSLIGDNAVAYEILAILFLVDLFTGVVLAFRKRNFSSVKFFGSGMKLLIYFALVIASHQVIRAAEGVPYIEAIESFVVVFLACTEWLSIVENAHGLGVPIPKWITNRLQSYITHGHEITKN